MIKLISYHLVVIQMEAFTRHYQSDLSPEEFFDLVYHHHIHAEQTGLRERARERSVKELDSIRRLLKPISLSTHCQIEGVHSILREQDRSGGSESHYVVEWLLREEIQRLTRDMAAQQERTRQRIEQLERKIEQLETRIGQKDRT